MAEPGEFLRAVTPNLARVLAQAAGSAYVTSATFYVVARYNSAHEGARPYDVQKPSATYGEAQALADGLNQSDPDGAYGVFGPFQNTYGGFPAAPPNATVAELHVTPQLGGEREDPFRIDGREFDALFYSVEAVEKFVLPYYVEEYGPDFGQQVLEQFYHAPLALMGHLPWSEYILVPDPDHGPDFLNPIGGNGHKPAAKYIPVFFHRDGTGKVQRQPLHPPRPAPAPVPATT
jgi:hypothetical protein